MVKHEHLLETVQHRDGKPPWCNVCGLTKDFTVPISRLKEKTMGVTEIEYQGGISMEHEGEPRKPYLPGMATWHDEKCGLEYRSTDDNVKTYWCPDHNQFAYEFAVRTRHIFASDAAQTHPNWIDDVVMDGPGAPGGG